MSSAWGRNRGLNAIMGQGLSVAILGGFRAVVADSLWLKAYLAWAACDAPATQATIRLVSAVDERPLIFWLNGARIMAYDVPQWRIQSAKQRGFEQPALRNRLVAEQAIAALEYLADARYYHPNNAALCVEIANVHLNCCDDPLSAANWYRRAAELPNAPYFAARIHAELLTRIGRRQEAYEWLCRLHPTLPPKGEGAMADVVLSRIRELEKTLQVVEEERYVAPAASPSALRSQKLN